MEDRRFSYSINLLNKGGAKVARIEMTCRRCGESKYVSVADGSLDKWHRLHRCPSKTIPSPTLVQLERFL